jgi:hypothetical protein
MSTLDMPRDRTNFSKRRHAPRSRRTTSTAWAATLIAGPLLLLSVQGCGNTVDPEAFIGASYDDAPFVDYITQNDCYRAEPGNYINCDSTGVSFLMEGGRVRAVFGANG